jgi:hypothetical protein
MGLVGGILRATGSQDVNVVSKVKNPQIQGQIDRSLGDLNANRAGEQAGLDDYISKYLANTANAERQTGQETGAIDKFYNGDMANQLSQLRASRQKAVGDAADVAAKQGLRSAAGNLVAGDGGGGSYASRLAMGATIPVKTQAALDNANQERADLNYLTTNQVNLAGARTGMQDTLAARGLMPSSARAAVYSRDLNQLGQATNLDQANKFYGLKKDSNTAADIVDSVDQGIMNAAAIYGSVAGGGMARGGPVEGPGDETSDSIRADLSDGEYVVPAAAVELPGVREFLDELRYMGLRRQKAKDMVKHFFRGGLVRHFAGGGLAEAASGLQARVDADLAPPTLIQPIMVPVEGGPMVPGQQMPMPQQQPRMAAPGGGGGGGYSPQQAYQDFQKGYDAWRNRNSNGPSGQEFFGPSSDASQDFQNNTFTDVPAMP